MNSSNIPSFTFRVFSDCNAIVLLNKELEKIKQLKLIRPAIVYARLRTPN